ncbi:hypothetical protein ACUOCP_24295, partial [Escherichia sp. R-CC3]
PAFVPDVADGNTSPAPVSAPLPPAAGFALSVEYWILLPAMILLMIESVASFAWFIRWFGRVVPGKPSEAVADAAPLPGSMRLVLIVLIVMSLISSVIAATWLQ